MTRKLPAILAFLLLLTPTLPMAAAVEPTPPPAADDIHDLVAAVRYALHPSTPVGAQLGSGVPPDRLAYMPPILNTLRTDVTAIPGLVADVRAAATVDAALAVAADLHGVTIPATPVLGATGDDLRTLFNQLYGQMGVSLTPEENLQLDASISELAPPVRDALAALVQSAILARERRDAAIATISAEDLAFVLDNADAVRDAGAVVFTTTDPVSASHAELLDRYTSITKKADNAKLLSAARTLQAGTDAARAALPPTTIASLATTGVDTVPANNLGPSPTPRVCNGEVVFGPNRGCILFQDPTFSVVVTGTGGARIASRTIVQLDLGGNTVYENNAGGATSSNPVSVSLDLGGIDTYASAGTVYEKVSMGSAAGGVGMLVDLGRAPDFYTGGDFSSGSANGIGVGVLVDDGGPSTFNGRLFAQGAAQGAGATGILLSQGDADDNYYASANPHDLGTSSEILASQGYGGLRGAGLLLDMGGADILSASTNGLSYAQGAGLAGEGILSLMGVPQRLIATSSAQAIGSEGLGMLLVGGYGDPVPRAYTAGSDSQARAMVAGVAVFLAGDAHDRVNDIYRAGDRAQAHAQTAGLAILFDMGGTDDFRAVSRGQGIGDLGGALLVNEEGADSYSRAGLSNDAVALAFGSTGGVVVDHVSETLAAISAEAMTRAEAQLDQYTSQEASTSILHLPIEKDIPPQLSVAGKRLSDASSVPLIGYYANTNSAQDGNDLTAQDVYAYTHGRAPPPVATSRCSEAPLNYQTGPEFCPFLTAHSGAEAAPPRPEPPIVDPETFVAWPFLEAQADPAAAAQTATGGTFFSSDANSLSDGGAWSATGLWKATTCGATDGIKSFGYVVSDTDCNYVHRDGNGASQTTSGALRSPVMRVPSGTQPTDNIAMVFWKYWLVEYTPSTKFDIMVVSVCDHTGNACVPLKQWDSQGASSPRWEQYVLNLNASRQFQNGFTIKWEFNTRDREGNFYTGWLVDTIRVYRNFPTTLLNTRVTQGEWQVKEQGGRQVLERNWLYNEEYSDGTKKSATRTERFEYVDPYAVHMLYVDTQTDTQGRTYKYTYQSKFVKNDYYNADTAIKRNGAAYEHVTINQDSGHPAPAIAGGYYTFFMVYVQYEGYYQGAYSKTYVLLVENQGPRNMKQTPDPNAKGDVNGDGSYFKLDAQYSMRFARNGAGQVVHHDGDYEPTTRAEGTRHYEFRVALNMMDIDSVTADAVQNYGYAKQIWDIADFAMEVDKTLGGLKEALGFTLVGVIESWITGALQTGDAIGIYITEKDTDICAGIFCLPYANTEVDATPNPLPFGYKPQLPGHLLWDQGYEKSWNHDFVQDVKAAFRPSPPDTLMRDDFDGSERPMVADGDLWRMSTTFANSFPRAAAFNKDTSPTTYATGKAESGFMMTNPMTLGAYGGNFIFDLWKETERCRSTRSDVFGAYWVEEQGQYLRFYKLREFSSVESESQRQAQWETFKLDLKDFGGRTGRLMFVISTVDKLNNDYRGWFIDNVFVESFGPGSVAPASFSMSTQSMSTMTLSGPETVSTGSVVSYDVEARAEDGSLVPTRASKAIVYAPLEPGTITIEHEEAGIKAIKTIEVVAGKLPVAVFPHAGKVEVVWTPLTQAPRESSYRVYRSTDGLAYLALATLPWTNRTFVDQNVVDGTRYFYKVALIGQAGEGNTSFPRTTVPTSALNAHAQISVVGGTAGAGGWYRTPVDLDLVATGFTNQDGYRPIGRITLLREEAAVGQNAYADEMETTTGWYTATANALTAPQVARDANAFVQGAASVAFSISNDVTTSNDAAPSFSKGFQLATGGMDALSFHAKYATSNPRNVAGGTFDVYAYEGGTVVARTVGATIAPGGWARFQLALDPNATRITRMTFVLHEVGKNAVPVAPEVQTLNVDAIKLASTSAMRETAEGLNLWSVLVEDEMAPFRQESLHVTLKVDRTAPVTTATAEGPTSGVYHTGPVRIVLAAKDGLSGVATIHYRIDGGSPTLYTGPITLVGSGMRCVYYWATDVAGNVETARSRCFVFDMTPPSTTISLSGPGDGATWFRGNVTVAITATDAVSGVESTYYSVDGGPMALGSHGGSPIVFVVSGPGGHTVSAYSMDKAGNVEPLRTRTFSIDTAPPVVTYRAPAPGSVVRSDATITVGHAEGEAAAKSGIDPAKTTFVLERSVSGPGGPWTDVTSQGVTGKSATSTTWSSNQLGGLAPALYRVRGTLSDKAGNVVAIEPYGGWTFTVGLT